MHRSSPRAVSAPIVPARRKCVDLPRAPARAELRSPRRVPADALAQVGWTLFFGGFMIVGSCLVVNLFFGVLLAEFDAKRRRVLDAAHPLAEVR